MRCPNCGSLRSSVVDSRYRPKLRQKRRKRQCLGCREIFITHERVTNNSSRPPRLIKRDGRREDFDRNKLRKGILLAIAKCPVSTEDVDSLLDRITERLAQAGKREVSAGSIGEVVMQELVKVDRTAYIRFASVYRDFKDAGAFRDEADYLESVTHLDVPSAQTEIVFSDAAASDAGNRHEDDE